MGSIYGMVSGDMGIYNEGDRRTPEIYGASKAAVINLTKYFSAYMAPDNVRVNCISPGGIFNHQDKDFVTKYSNKVPMNRMGFEDELSSTLEYLLSSESSYVTGQNIAVDGGFTSW
jgi:NAD(P)-dependent dehydrogenase (short-subunit alcohol dehydrogenase family)